MTTPNENGQGDSALRPCEICQGAFLPWVNEDTGKQEYCVCPNCLQGESSLHECVREIVQDWREYLIGVGSCFPPNEDEYRTMFAKMTANLEEAKSLIE